MKIGVLLKQVPDTETKIRIKADASGIETDGVKFIVSPYDEYAIEEAIKTKEKNAGSEVIAISMGPARAVDSIRTALAMGADKGVHIDDEGQALDSYVTAKVLAGVIKEQGLEVIFTGKQAIDADMGQVSQSIAEFLDWPQVTILEKIEFVAGKAIATRRVSGGAKEIYDVALPALFACEKGLNTPRYASLPNIMKAKSKPIQSLKVSALKGDASAKVLCSNYRLPPEKAPGKIIPGEAEAAVKELVKLLREEAKVI
ncbi:MAG: electron transfer flavoprotein subunit beta/FixA family protein [Deltaproteobacteria bacterium]|nr:electron transfer flavoprotein subunit beta/FixA family protein [Deltaproteobacteria bacterium]